MEVAVGLSRGVAVVVVAAAEDLRMLENSQT